MDSNRMRDLWLCATDLGSSTPRALHFASTSCVPHLHTRTAQLTGVVTSGFEAEVAAAPLGTLRGAVAEHGRWLRSNCASQLKWVWLFLAAPTGCGRGVWRKREEGSGEETRREGQVCGAAWQGGGKGSGEGRGLPGWGKGRGLIMSTGGRLACAVSA
eukprot:362220-Chlamydomonas_euryale.AAC.18